LARILIVDDEAALLRSIQLQLTRNGHECRGAETIAAAIGELARGDCELAIVDIRLPDGNGLDLIRRIRAEGHSFPLVVLTAFGSVPHAVTAMRDGATDYLEKPVDLEQLSFIVERNLETARLRGRIELYERAGYAPSDRPELVGDGDVFRRAVDLAQRVAAPGVTEAADMPTVLITGETGTGKDVFARYIHGSGPLSAAPFVHVDCASLPRELVESELFGHERGAFTDAKTTKKGLLEMASGGTVFLNEIGELSADLQAKLLTCLEGKRFRRVGGTRDLRMNARIIAATNADLKERVAAGTFREDLFYRLNVFHLHLAPLRERGADILLLATHFVRVHCRKYRKAEARLSPAARQALADYAWPGNVRELSHVLERAALLQEHGVIEAAHLGIGSAAAPDGDACEPDVGNLLAGLTLPEMERRMVQQALAEAAGNVSQAARLLGISRGALRRRLEAMSEGQPAAE
jgi:DNA-binding NtrC family response regulator